MIHTGDKVAIYPHGNPAQSAVGHVVICSANQRSIALQFDGLPPFARRKNGIAIDTSNLRITMLLIRHDVGPWIEIGGGGHYEIEERTPDPRTEPYG